MILRIVAMVMSLVACSTEIKQPTAQSSYPPNAFELENLYSRGRSIDAMMRLSKTQGLGSAEFAWLSMKAASGVPPFQFELSRQFHQSGAPVALVVEEYAKAYVLRSLDFSECADKNLNPVNIVLLSVYGPLKDVALKHPTGYAVALEKALKWERDRDVRPSSDWICEGVSLPTKDRAAARSEQIAEILAGIERLKQKGAGQ